MGSEIEMKKYCHRRGEKFFKENTSLSQTKQKQEQKNKKTKHFVFLGLKPSRADEETDGVSTAVIQLASLHSNSELTVLFVE
jgi:hypothetical protein